jgi:exodeoxyribonuclease VII large subunit
VKIAPLEYGDRKVYSVSAFNRGVAEWLTRLPTLWVEGEVTELRRHAGWKSVFFTLKDPSDGACLPATMPRGRFEALRLDLKRKLGAEGLFAPDRKRPLPRFPRAIGLVTGNDAAAKRDVVTTLTARFPPARVVVAETYVQGPRAAAAIVDALHALAALPEVDVIVVARGGGSFEDLLPFSDERLVRAIATSPVPVVSAVGHEQDTPLCDLAADVRASTPTAAGRLVVPDLGELFERLDGDRDRLTRAAERNLAGERDRLALLHDRLRRAPSLALERKRAALAQSTGRLRALSPKATLTRGYAIVRTDDGIVRSPAAVRPGQPLRVEVAEGEFGARVE